MYATHYDTAHKKFMTVELNDENIKAYENDSTKETLVKFDSLQLATANTQISNHNIEVGEFIVEICKDCKRSFVITKKEAEWFKDKNYALPVRCYPCRKKRKENKS